MAKQKVGIAMSGGVDSSVTASLLQQKGCDVHGFFMLLPVPGKERHVQRVRSVAEHLEIPLYCIDLQDLFNRKVIDYFIRTYLDGDTPNPCIVCNRQVKFGALLNVMRSRGMDKMATGHYARIRKKDTGEYILQKGCDPKKDQSYFLCRLTQAQLENVILPLGDYTKEEVYGLAAALKLSTIHGPESQDVCFLAGESVAAFFAGQGIGDRPGDIINTEGRVIGEHRGLWQYTVGQRKGLSIPDATPWYVYRLDAGNNRLVVCKKDRLFCRKVITRDVRWTGAAQPNPWRGRVQIRGRHLPSPATVAAGNNGEAVITFEAGQRAITPGQFAVFYEDDFVAGSAVITGAIAGEDIDL
ncbi:MAG: tRNA 2-thiouridine(34) synthase MnmA [Desulfobulbaceae bacterium]|nr:tRNA 2-thiouridine(34) synthase MnmA [Desulfobulbaceae bacterium]